MRGRTRLLKWCAILAVVAMVAVACGGGDDDSSGEDSFDGVTEAGSFDESGGDDGAAAAASPASGDADASLGNGGVPTALQPVDIGRQIIFTADLTVAVPDVASASAEATTVIESMGGFLFGQQSTVNPVAVSTLTFKIDPDDFQPALARLGGIGELRTQNISADDVTERVVDLESRITTAEASVERLRALLETAATVDIIAELETQLLDRETQLETMRGQLRTLQDAVDLATIVMTLTEALSDPQIQLEVSGYPGTDDEGASCPGEFGFTVEEGDAVTVCFELRNTGDTPLTDLEVTDSVLGIELTDLRVVFGDPAATMEPGQSVILAATTTVERNLRTQTRVSALPINSEGSVIEARPATASASLFVDARDPGGLPGFGDGLSGSVELLRGLVELLIFLAGAVLPFIWVVPLFWWLRRRRAAQKAAKREARVAAAIDAPQVAHVPAGPSQSVVDGTRSEAAEASAASGDEDDDEDGDEAVGDGADADQAGAESDD